MPKSSPGSGAEIERGFFLCAIHLLKAGKELGGRDGNKSGAVTEKDSKQAELQASKDGKHEQREAGDDSRKNKGKKHKPAEEGFAGEAGAVESERSQQAQRERKSDSTGRDDEAIENGIPNGAVGEELTIPVEGEMARRKTSHAISIKRVQNENHDREIDESEDKERITCEPRRAARCEILAHL